MNIRTLLLCYSVIIVAGGVIGFIKAHSIASLISGITFGALILTSSILLKQREELGRKCALALSAFLTLFFAYRFIGTFALFPSGMMAIISFGVFSFILLKNKKPVQGISSNF